MWLYDIYKLQYIFIKRIPLTDGLMGKFCLIVLQPTNTKKHYNKTNRFSPFSKDLLS